MWWSWLHTWKKWLQIEPSCKPWLSTPFFPTATINQSETSVDQLPGYFANLFTYMKVGRHPYRWLSIVPCKNSEVMIHPPFYEVPCLLNEIKFPPPIAVHLSWFLFSDKAGCGDCTSRQLWYVYLISFLWKIFADTSLSVCKAHNEVKVLYGPFNSNFYCLSTLPPTTG